ncbi:MAG TPA: hypothetical protein VE396_15525 [Xanthobacteraceae bacterium]|nr:hypothetical protein [Xanthobacteraceae bacterium]
MTSLGFRAAASIVLFVPFPLRLRASAAEDKANDVKIKDAKIKDAKIEHVKIKNILAPLRGEPELMPAAG